MNKTQTSAKEDPFLSLDKPKQTFIRLDFEGKLSNKEIASKVGVNREATISNWRSQKWYLPARKAYIEKVIDYKYKDKALQTVFNLLTAKSEMVRLQAATTVFKLSGMLSDNSTPELDRARIRKANADARISEAKAKAMEDKGQDIELLLDKMLDNLAKEDLKNGSE